MGKAKADSAAVTATCYACALSCASENIGNHRKTACGKIGRILSARRNASDENR